MQPHNVRQARTHKSGTNLSYLERPSLHRLARRMRSSDSAAFDRTGYEDLLVYLLAWPSVVVCVAHFRFALKAIRTAERGRAAGANARGELV